MHKLKNHSLLMKKHQEKISVVKNSHLVLTDDRNNDIIRIAPKNLKSKTNSTDLNLKSPEKNTEFKQSPSSNCFPHPAQSPNKHAVKRKDDKGNNQTNRKKIRIETSSLDSKPSSDSTLTKKQKKPYKSSFPKTYICKYCCRRYNSVEQLRLHSLEHGNKPSHTCHLCNHQTASFSALMTHYLKHSGNKGKELEKIYAKSKADFSNLQFNLFSRPKTSFICSKCNTNFTCKSKFEGHSCSAAVKKSEYKCAYCGHICMSVEEYRNHIQSHVETPFVCSLCKYKAMTKKLLDAHHEHCKKRQKLKIEFKCDKCTQFVGKSRKELNHHLKVCGKESSVTYNCKMCSAEFEDKKIYENHLATCKTNKKEKSSPKKIIKSRKKHKESISTKNKLACCVCETVCNSKADHEEHERQCLAEMANNPIEKTSFSSSKRSSPAETSKVPPTNKITHDEIEVGIEKRSPEDNARRSNRLVSRKSSSHDEDVDDNDNSKIKKPKILKLKIPKKPKLLMKPRCRKGRQSKNPNNSFLCNYCDFTFCSKSTLLRHKRMHSGNPWYVCQYCGKFFFRKDVYIRHEENVHKKSSKMVYCCYYCRLCFNDSASLKEHVEAVHKGSAFLPTKQRLSGKGNGANNVKPTIKIKQEPNEITQNNSTEPQIDSVLNKNSLSETVSSFKCSVCSQSFENAADMQAHEHVHMKDASKTKKCNKALKSSKIKNMRKRFLNGQESVVPLKKEPISTDIVNLSNDVLDFSLSSNKTDQTKSDCCDNKDTGDSNIEKGLSDMDDLKEDTEVSNESMKCKLCSKQFTDRTLFETHGKTPHKIVDWYQCLVCSYCGPKQELLEHMLMHMFKVGSFIVSGSEDYANIIALQVADQNKMRGNTSAHLEKQNSSASENILVSDNELPPLRKYGICPCVCSESAQNDDDDDESLSAEKNVTEEECMKQSEETERSVIENECKKQSEETEFVSEVNLDSSPEKNPGNHLNKAETLPLQIDPISSEISAVSCEAQEVEKEVAKLDETNSSEVSMSVKENLSEENSSTDCNQSENFSQLRYLLQSPNMRNSSENNIPLYPFSQFDSSEFLFDKTKPASSLNLNLEASNIALKNDSHFESSKQNEVCNDENNYKLSLSVESSQSNTNTCLKFDINQSRSEFLENLSSLSQKIKDCNEIDKIESNFKSCPPQNAILDFSDLLHPPFENSSPSEDNLFSYATSYKPVAMQSGVNVREEVHTPECSDSINYNTLRMHSSVKCNNCKLVIHDHNEQINHKCFLTRKYPSELPAFPDDSFSLYKSKNAFQSFSSIGNQNKPSDVYVSPVKKVDVPVSGKYDVFPCSLCSKISVSEAEFLRHQKTEHAQGVHSAPHSNICTKCHRTFSDIGELIKHSLTCLKTYFLKNALVGNSLTSPESVQTSNKKDELNKNSSFPVNCTLPLSTVSSDVQQSPEKTVKHPFNS